MSNLATLGPNGWETNPIIKKGHTLLALSAASASVTGTVAETVLATIPVPAGALGVNGMLRITTLWSYTNSANSKNMRIRFGGTAFMSVSATNTASLQHMTMIRNRAENSQIGFGASAGAPFSTTAVVPVTGAVDSKAAQTITIAGVLADVGETITLESYTVELLNP